MSTPTTLTGHAEVTRALRDPALTTAPPDGIPASPAGTVEWLRASVPRFCAGTDHHRRRRLVTDLLDPIPPATLRAPARSRAAAVLAAAGSPVDLASTVARTVPVGVLAAALWLPRASTDTMDIGDMVDMVNTVAAAYQPGTHAAGADAAVGELIAACGGTADEVTAARICVLVQACAATATLVVSAARAALRSPYRPAETVVSEVLRHDPPVRYTRRTTASGAVLRIDLWAGGLPFGAGPHACPGRDHAIAVAAGVLDALAGYRLTEPDPSTTTGVSHLLVTSAPELIP